MWLWLIEGHWELELRIALVYIRRPLTRTYSSMQPVGTPVCALPAFYFTMSDTTPQPTHDTPPNQGRVGAMGRCASGSFSASRRGWCHHWRAILRQCTRLYLLVDTSHQEYQLRISLNSFSSFSSYSDSGFSMLLVFAFWLHRVDRFRGF
jgi:hypothetical protein